jgi:hypothetical protein
MDASCPNNPGHRGECRGKHLSSRVRDQVSIIIAAVCAPATLMLRKNWVVAWAAERKTFAISAPVSVIMVVTLREVETTDLP